METYKVKEMEQRSYHGVERTQTNYSGGDPSEEIEGKSSDQGSTRTGNVSKDKNKDSLISSACVY